MKRLILLLMAILAAVSVSGQEIEPKTSGGKRAKIPFEQQHEVRVSVGIEPLYAIFQMPFDGYYDNFHIDRTFDGPTYTTGAINLSYGYRFRRWFDFGVLFSYNTEYKRQFDALTGDYLHRIYQHHITIMPTVRFTWLNRKWLRMYSSLGMGVTFGVQSITEKQQLYDTDRLAFGFQCTCLGITVGKSFFGFAELGVGAKGTAVFGIGYRFNNPKHQ